MTKLLKAAVCGLVWMTASTCTVHPAFGATAKEESALVLNLVNNAEVPEDLLMEAQKDVERIFKKAGIAIEWGRGRGLKLTIILLSDCGIHASNPDHQLRGGLAISNSGRGLRRAYVFPSHVKDQVRRWLGATKGRGSITAGLRNVTSNHVRVEALMLGHVIAHEVGHLLLPPGSHSLTGLMSAYFDKENIRRTAESDLHFSDSESRLMRSALLFSVATGN